MPLKNAADYPSSGCHNVWRAKKRKTEKTKKLQFIGSNESELPGKSAALSYCITIIFLPWFCSKTPASDVSVSLSFQESSWKQSWGCDWTLRAAPELYFEEETTEPQIMLYSPLVSTTVIRFSLCKILEKGRRYGFLQSKGHCIDFTLETFEEHETSVKSRTENKSKKLKWM